VVVDNHGEELEGQYVDSLFEAVDAAVDPIHRDSLRS
jgi:hypothetical protein